MPSRPHWIIVVDSRRAALFSCKRHPGGNPALESRSHVESDISTEHHRPSFLGGGERRSGFGGASGHAAPQHASYGHQADEQVSRFVREVSRWMGSVFQEHSIEPHGVTVFAAPSLFGELRAAHEKLDVRQADLAGLDAARLAAHPRVVDALNQAARSNTP